MPGIIVQLIISWIIIRLVEKKDLSILRLWPSGKKLAWFVLFFLVTSFFASSGFLLRIYYGERWVLNPVFSFSLLMDGLWYNIKSVLYEELIFRGVLLYILVKRLGINTGIIISAVGFGIYHWFTYEILGDIKMMLFIFFITGIAGLLYAYGYAKSNTLWIPIAIHLGWNFTRNFIFSDGNIGNGVLIYSKPAFTSTVSHFIYYLIAYFPMMGALGINWLIIKKKYNGPEKQNTSW
ncbi:MAG: CPBP family intramembrane metalloprotease [Rhizobacter sp.]|nr:CPBP family intramembrane metalloprotease [Ferruginibacter sp.]